MSSGAYNRFRSGRLVAAVAGCALFGAAMAQEPNLGGYEKGKFEIKSANGLHSLKVAGRLMYDTTFVGDDGDYDGASETQFRRARLAVSGKLYRVFDYKLQIDFEDADDGGQAIEDAYLRYKHEGFRVTFGQKKAPYSMNELTSSKYIAFLERSFASNFFGSEALGIGGRSPGITFTYDAKDSGLLLEGGYYFLRIPGGDERSLDDGHGATGRVVYSKHDKELGALFHIGASGGFRKYGNDGIARVRVRPGVSEGDRIIDTNDPIEGADEYISFNANVAFAVNRVWGNAEFFYGQFENSEPGDDEATGFYFQGGVFLTNDSRPYKNGAWAAVKPSNPVHKGGAGAFELALRYSELELGSAQIEGSNSNQTGSALTAALNWYPTPQVRFQFNYVKAFGFIRDNSRHPDC